MLNQSNEIQEQQCTKNIFPKIKYTINMHLANFIEYIEICTFRIVEGAIQCARKPTTKESNFSDLDNSPPFVGTVRSIVKTP